MGRAYYRFGHDIALRVANGQAFALKDAELGVAFAPDSPPHCFLRGNFTAVTYRGLVARGLLPPNAALQGHPVSVQLNLPPELAQSYCPDVAQFLHFGRRLDQNSLTDEVARNALTFELWRYGWVAPLGQRRRSGGLTTSDHGQDSAQDAAYNALVTGMTQELWQAVESVGEVAEAPQLRDSMELADAVASFFEDEGWGWQEVAGVEALWRTFYDGQNGSWMCYTRILPELDQVVFYSICPVSVPTTAINVMVEFVCRVNAELSLGNFEIDFGHQIVRLRTSVDVTDVGMSPLLFRNMVFQNLAVMDIHLPQMLGIIAGQQSALPAA